MVSPDSEIHQIGVAVAVQVGHRTGRVGYGHIGVGPADRKDRVIVVIDVAVGVQVHP